MRWPWRGPCFAEPNLPVAFHDPVSWELKLLVDRREDLVGQRVAVMNRLFWRLHQIDPGRPEPKKLQHAVRRASPRSIIFANSPGCRPSWHARKWPISAGSVRTSTW